MTSKSSILTMSFSNSQSLGAAPYVAVLIDRISSVNNSILCQAPLLRPRWSSHMDSDSNNICITLCSIVLLMWYFLFVLTINSYPILASCTCLRCFICVSRLSRRSYCTVLIALSSAISSVTSLSISVIVLLAFFLFWISVTFSCIGFAIIYGLLE